MLNKDLTMYYPADVILAAFLCYK